MPVKLPSSSRYTCYWTCTELSLCWYNKRHPFLHGTSCLFPTSACRSLPLLLLLAKLAPPPPPLPRGGGRNNYITQTERQLNRQTDRQTDKQTNKQCDPDEERRVLAGDRHSSALQLRGDGLIGHIDLSIL